MSYDLMVFDPTVAPKERHEFMLWFAKQTEWTEDHSYQDHQVASERLQAWFKDMIEYFPPMNGPFASGDHDDSKVTDYSIGRSVIYSAFAWSVAEDAYSKMRELAIKHSVGFFDVSADDGEILFPHQSTENESSLEVAKRKTTEHDRRNIKRLVSIIAFIAAYFAVQFGVDYYRDYSALKSANTEIEALREKVRNENPDEPEAIAFHRAAVKKVEDVINSSSNYRERLQFSAGAFFGYYIVNSRIRAEFCQDQGVDIARFSSAFKDSHESEYAIAERAISAKPADLEAMYEMLKSQSVSVIEQDMEYIASVNGLSLHEACKLMSDNADMIVPDMHISVVQPAVYKVLTSDK